MLRDLLYLGQPTMQNFRKYLERQFSRHNLLMKHDVATSLSFLSKLLAGRIKKH